MEKLKAIRGGHKNIVTRLINSTDEKIAENDVGDQELSAVIETLVKKRNLLNIWMVRFLKLQKWKIWNKK